MKKIIMGIVILSCFFSMNIFADAMLQEHVINDQADKEIEETMAMRKISVSRLLTGLGSTCLNLGMAIISPDDQSKQQAALGIVASLLTMAGGIVGEQEKEQEDRDAGVPESDLAERKKRLEVIVRSCIEEIKDNPLYLEKVALRGLGGQFLDDIEISGEAIKDLIVEMLYSVRDTFKEGLTFISITRSMNKDVENIGKIDQKAMGFMEAIMHFITTTLQQEDTFSYLKEQLFLLVDYVKETLGMSFVKEVAEGLAAGDHNGNVVAVIQDELIEEIEEAIEDFIDHETEVAHSQSSTN